MRLVVKALIAVLIVALLGAPPAAAENSAPRTTKCLQCQPLVDDYNNATAAVARLQAERDRLEAEKSAAQQRMDAAKEQLDRASYRLTSAEDDLRVGRLNGRAQRDLNKAEEKVATEQRALDDAKARSAELKTQMESLQSSLGAAEAALEESKAAHAAAATKLDACERLCAARGGISTITPDGLVVTWCEACKDLEAALNQTIRERRRIDGQIVLAQSKLRASLGEEAAAQREQRAAFDEATAAITEGNRLRDAKSPDAEAIKAADRRASAASARAIDLDDRLSELAAKRQSAKEEVDRLIDRRDRVLPKLEADQRAALEDCENTKCGPPAPDRVALPAMPTTVTTDCPACQGLAAELQETLQAIAAKGAEVDGANRDVAGEWALLTAAAEADKGAHEDEIERLEAIHKTLLAEYNALVRLAKEQRTDLENCEKDCKKEPPRRPLPDLRTSLLQQDDECRRNKECALVATLVNDGADAVGQLFISIDAKVALPEGGQINGLTCLAAAKGRTLCYGESVSLDAGASLVLALPVIAEPEVCLAREMPDINDRTTIGAWVQFGLASRGFSPGAIDGQTGPKTFAAIGALLQSDDAPAPADMTDEELLVLLDQRTTANRDRIEPEVFQRLFGEQPPSADEQKEALACVGLRLVREKVTPKPSSEVVVPEEEEVVEEEEDAIRLSPGIEFEFDLNEEDENEPAPDEDWEGFPDEESPGLGDLEFGF